MSDIAISVENLGKMYHIGGPQERYKTLRESLMRSLTDPIRRLRPGIGEDRRETTIWALDDVSFDVKQGEVVGIIGRNGAGKSTLLKILSRITEPTRGRVRVRGRVGSLLEVGTGFHPELTGRENIYLNGAILGMRRADIERKFDEIVAFAEIETFLDTPVKRYSSGMYVRLAFAVAAHLEPEILLVDEVLAVGDHEFQKKCLGRMQEVGREGRTVLFISHNMQAITRMCKRTLMIDRGRVAADAESATVVSAYMNSGLGTTSVRVWPDLEEAPGDETVRLTSARVETEASQPTDLVEVTLPSRVIVGYRVMRDGVVLVPNLHFFNEDGVRVFVSLDTDPRWRNRPRPAGDYVSVATIPGNLLAEGTLYVSIAISTLHPHVTHVYESDVLGFQVFDSLSGESARGDYAGVLPGVMRPHLHWTTERVPVS